MGGGGGREAREERVRPGRRRTGLRQEQGGEEERMIGNLDDPDLALAAQPAYPESAGLEQSVVVRVDTVVAVIVLGRLGNAVERRGAAIGEHEDRLRLPDERARERRDNEPPGTGRRLGVVGVSEPENVARELDDRVLEAASGTDEGNSPFPRVADRRERAVHAAVRTRRCDPDSVVRSESLLGLV